MGEYLYITMDYVHVMHVFERLENLLKEGFGILHFERGSQARRLHEKQRRTDTEWETRIPFYESKNIDLSEF